MIPRENIREAIRCIQEGGVILYPTATVYGLGGDPTRSSVVDRIRRIKERPSNKPMLLLTDEWSRVEAWISGRGPLHEQLISQSPPLSLTILFQTHASELTAVRGGAPTIGIRCTNHPLCRELIRGAGFPLISTSANRAGDVPPRRFDEIDPRIREAVDVSIDAGRPLKGVPSTVVAVDDGGLNIVREGAVSEAELAEVIDHER